MNAYYQDDPTVAPATSDAVSLVDLALDAAAEAVEMSVGDDRPMVTDSVLHILRSILAMEGLDAEVALRQRLTEREQSDR